MYGKSFTQSLFSTAGKSASNTNLKLDYTIGEPVIVTKSNGNIILTQGFHQPNYQFVTKVTQLLKNDLKINLFPNPSNQTVSLEIKNIENRNLILDIVDISGQYIQQNILILSEQTVVNVSQFAAGVYFFQIRDNKENQQAIYSITKQN